jgi:hypothetical protein
VSIGPRCGSRTATPASRTWRRRIRSASPMSCATSSTPSTVATTPLRHGCGRCCAGRVGRRRGTLRPTTLRQYHVGAERRLDALVVMPTAHPAGRELQAAVKAWRTKFFRLPRRSRRAAHQQRLRARNPPLRRVPQDHRRLPLAVGRSDPRRIPLHHRHRPASRPNRALIHQQPARRSLPADTGNLKPGW